MDKAPPDLQLKMTAKCPLPCLVGAVLTTEAIAANGEVCPGGWTLFGTRCGEKNALFMDFKIQ